MTTFKKKDIKNYKSTEDTTSCGCDIDESEEIVETEEIDELVTSTGGSISGDEKNVNNSEIETAPQATNDQFAATAIQPNRYLYGVSGTGYSRGANFNTMESIDKLAKDKMINLLETISGDAGDSNNNNTADIKELSPNVASKVNILISTVNKNNLNSNEITIMLNEILKALVPQLDDADRQSIKDKI